MANLVLATPIMRGKSDTITNYEEASATLEGQPFQLDDNGNMVPFDGTKAIKGVAAYQEMDKCRAGILAGLGVVVRISESDSPVIGHKVYVDPATKLFTSDDTKTPTRAIWASTKSDAINARTGATVANCAAIDFEGGLNG